MNVCPTESISNGFLNYSSDYDEAWRGTHLRSLDQLWKFDKYGRDQFSQAFIVDGIIASSSTHLHYFFEYLFNINYSSSNFIEDDFCAIMEDDIRRLSSFHSKSSQRKEEQTELGKAGGIYHIFFL